jgi:hypothetical protein
MRTQFTSIDNLWRHVAKNSRDMTLSKATSTVNRLRRDQNRVLSVVVDSVLSYSPVKWMQNEGVIPIG